jgi:hypothetical protein
VVVELADMAGSKVDAGVGGLFFAGLIVQEFVVNSCF